MNNNNTFFSFRRLKAMLVKEFIHMKRDRVTVGMILGIPVMQLILFGYAINSNPKHLPTALVLEDYSYFSRTVLAAVKNSQYFDWIAPPMDEKQADHLLATGKTQFTLKIPSDFSRELVRNHHPNILLVADATDGVAVSNAMAAANQLPYRVFNQDRFGLLPHLKWNPPPFNIIVHTKYNPELETKFYIIPGLMGVTLTMTLVVVAAQVLTREREQGTLESLLSKPLTPLEIILGKIIPFIIIGYIQIIFIVLLAVFLFQIPIEGHLIWLFLTALPFIASNLSMGITFSTISDNQLQATQMAVFFMLPSILLSGFMFPFYGMPHWAQMIGHCLPLTYFLRLTRGIILKGNGLIEIIPNTWPMLIFMVIALAISIIQYRKTLD